MLKCLGQRGGRVYSPMVEWFVLSAGVVPFIFKGLMVVVRCLLELETLLVTGVIWCGVGVENKIIGVGVDMAKRNEELTGVIEVVVRG